MEPESSDGEVRPEMGGWVKLIHAGHDPRGAIHSPPRPPRRAGRLASDAKLAGGLAEIPPAPHNEHLGAGFFRLDIREVAITYVGKPDDHPVIESWHPDHGWRRRTHRTSIKPIAVASMCSGFHHAPTMRSTAERTCRQRRRGHAVLHG